MTTRIVELMECYRCLHLGNDLFRIAVGDVAEFVPVQLGGLFRTAAVPVVGTGLCRPGHHFLPEDFDLPRRLGPLS